MTEEEYVELLRSAHSYKLAKFGYLSILLLLIVILFTFIMEVVRT